MGNIENRVARVPAFGYGLIKGNMAAWDYEENKAQWGTYETPRVLGIYTKEKGVSQKGDGLKRGKW